MGVFVIGKNCKLYYGAAGSTADTLLPNTIDVTLSMNRDQVDASSRESGEYAEYASTLIDAELSWQMKWKPGDAGFEAIRDAFLTGDAIALLPLDGLVATAGSQGLDADWTIVDFSRVETLRDIVKVSVRAKPTPSSREPDWLEVGAGP